MPMLPGTRLDHDDCAGSDGLARKALPAFPTIGATPSQGNVVGDRVVAPETVISVRRLLDQNRLPTIREWLPSIVMLSRLYWLRTIYWGMSYPGIILRPTSVTIAARNVTPLLLAKRAESGPR